jgi:hypothetical protein
MEPVLDAFFRPTRTLQATLAVLCDCQPQQGNKPGAVDPVTQTVLTMIACPVHVQLTAVGWQPFKGKDLTFPYQRMTVAQRETLRRTLEDAEGWGAYEHALVLRHPVSPRLPTLDVLDALCTTILHSAAYPDRRLRVAVCNIVLQRVQASLPVEKGTLRALNDRLFPADGST